MTAQEGRRLIVEADGGSRGNPGPAAFGAVVRDAGSGRILAERASFLGTCSNNVAEYSGLLAGIETALAIDRQAVLEVRMDSRLVIQQMAGHWKLKHPDMRRLAGQATQLLEGVSVTFTWVPRAENGDADRLANEAMDSGGAVSRDYGTAGPTDRPIGGLTGRTSGNRAGGGAALDPAEHNRWVGARSQAGASGGARVWTAAASTVLVLCRHGVTEATGRRTFSGSLVPGPSLSAEGRAQAEAAAQLVRRITVGRLWPDVGPATHLLHSPTARTTETAHIIGQAIGLPAKPDQSFVEAGFGDWDGLTPDQVEARWPGGVRQWSTDPAYHPAGGGESLTEVGARLRPGIVRVLEEHPAQTVVIASHVIAIRAAVGVALGAPPMAWMRLRIAPASVTALRFWPSGETEILGINWTQLDV